MTKGTRQLDLAASAALVATDSTATAAATTAELLIDPASVGGVIVSDYLAPTGDIDLHAGIMTALDGKVAAVRDGDMAGLEAMLVGQAYALNAIFTDFARRAALNRTEHPQAFERYTRLGFKAQAQCRATVEAIAEMKNPPVVFARTANLVNGHQQNNNYGSDHAPARKLETNGQPHAANGPLVSGDGTSLPCSNSIGNGVPIASDAERPMSNARRKKPRRAQGKSECVEARGEIGRCDRDGIVANEAGKG